jgi:hypothetical protein
LGESPNLAVFSKNQFTYKATITVSKNQTLKEVKIMKKFISLLCFLVFVVILSSPVYAAGLTQVSTDGFEARDNNLANALTKEINDAFSMIDSGHYVEAINKLQSDILGKTDGCATRGVPDNNDWLKACNEQDQVYPVIIEVINYLNSQL